MANAGYALYNLVKLKPLIEKGIFFCERVPAETERIEEVVNTVNKRDLYVYTYMYNHINIRCKMYTLTHRIKRQSNHS